MSAPRQVDTPRGNFTLRPAEAADDDFLFRLFRDTKIGILHMAQIPEAQIPALIAFQHQSRAHTYRTLYPAAVNSIIEWSGQPIGLLIEHDEGDTVYVVDVELMPEHQRQGLGTALMRAVMDEWAARGRGIRVKVAVENEPSLALWRKLGFVETGLDPSYYLGMRWDPPGREPVAAPDRTG